MDVRRKSRSRFAVWGRAGTAEVLIERQLFVKKSSSRSRMRSMFTLSCVRSAFLSAAGGTPRGGGWTGRGAGSGRRRRTVEHRGKAPVVVARLARAWRRRANLHEEIREGPLRT